MSAQFEMQDDVIRRNHAMRNGLHDHLIRTAEARQRQAEAIVKGVHWVWTRTRRALERLTNGKSREQTSAANGKQISKSLGRASVADAFRRDLLAPGATGPPLHPRAVCPQAPAQDRHRPAEVAGRSPVGRHRLGARPNRAGGRRHAAAPWQVLLAAGRTTRASRGSRHELPMAA